MTTLNNFAQKNAPPLIPFFTATSRQTLPKIVVRFRRCQPVTKSQLPTNEIDTKGGTIYKQHSQNGWIYFETSAAASFVLERGVPQRLLAFGALIVDFPDPPLGVAYAAAPPVE